MPFARGTALLLGAGAAAVLALALIARAGIGAPEASAQDATATATATATPAPLPECSNGTAVANPASNAGLVADCSVLLRAKDALRGTATLNWSATRAISGWDGIGLTASDPKRVSSITLIDKGLTGSIPPGLAGLGALTFVDLGNNLLTGTIPAELGNLSGLTRLNLDINRLTGTIPAELGNLSNLEYLNLNDTTPSGYPLGTRLTGEIPASFANLTSLRKLHITGLHLTGTIPDLSGATGLQVLNLRNQRMTGEIPSWLGTLTGLQRLILAENRLTGEIPLSLVNLTPAAPASLTLFDLKLRGNSLTGCIPPLLRRVSQHDLALLSLSDCALPTAPTGLAATAGDRTAWLSWTDPGGEGRARVTGYRYRTGPTAAWRERVCDGVVLLTGMRTIRLTNGTTFNLELQARNVYGWGPSAPAAVTPAASATAMPAPTAKPPAPSGVMADGGDRRIELSWTRPGVVHSEHWLRYAYRLRPSGGEWGVWQANDCSHEAVGGMTLTGLDAGETYEVQLRSRNAAGWSPSSATISATTAPPAPANLAAVSEDGGALLTWSDPGAGVTGYRYRTGPAATWRTLAHDADAIAAIRVRGLTNGAFYTLELQAQNAGGWGPSGEASVTPSAPASAP